MKKKTPPKSNRFCLCCQKVTTFEYDRVICHSRCEECGQHQARKPTLDDEIKRLIQEVNILKIKIVGLKERIKIFKDILKENERKAYAFLIL